MTGSVFGMVPGTRLAFGCRWGSPAAVDPADDGDSTALAARQPTSAGDDQRLPVADVLGALRPFPNQLDSTAL
jgi:hypothetical protein